MNATIIVAITIATLCGELSKDRLQVFKDVFTNLKPQCAMTYTEMNPPT